MSPSWWCREQCSGSKEGWVWWEGWGGRRKSLFLFFWVRVDPKWNSKIDHFWKLLFSPYFPPFLISLMELQGAWALFQNYSLESCPILDPQSYFFGTDPFLWYNFINWLLKGILLNQSSFRCERQMAIRKVAFFFFLRKLLVKKYGFYWNLPIIKLTCAHFRKVGKYRKVY